MRLTRDTSNVPSYLQPPNGGATMAQTDQTSPHIKGPPLQGRNFVTADAIGERETTTQEDISDRIMEMLETLCDLSDNQEKHQI